MPNEFQRVMDSLLKNIPLTNCYIDDILIASKGSLNEHKAILTNKHFKHFGQQEYGGKLGAMCFLPKKNRVARFQDIKLGRETIGGKVRFD